MVAKLYATAEFDKLGLGLAWRLTKESQASKLSRRGPVPQAGSNSEIYRAVISNLGRTNSGLAYWTEQETLKADVWVIPDSEPASQPTMVAVSVEFLITKRGHAVRRMEGVELIPFDTVWARIKAHEGENFRQIRGGVFTYVVTGSAIAPDRTNQLIPRRHLELATRMLPLRNTVPLQNLRGPSYIYAVLMDRRIRGTDW